VFFSLKAAFVLTYAMDLTGLGHALEIGIESLSF